MAFNGPAVEELEWLGHHVVAVATEDEALEALLAEPTALFMQDVWRPNQLGGIEFLRKVREHAALAGIPTLIVSAATPPAHGYIPPGAEGRPGLPVQGWLVKPFTVEAFVAEVRKLVP